MFGFSVIQLARKMGHKLDRELRRELVHLYHPFRQVPCFLHRPLDNIAKRTKKLPVIIEFEKSDDAFVCGLADIKKLESKIVHEFQSISCCAAKLSIKKLETLLGNCKHIKKIYYDREMSVLLDAASPSIHAKAVNDTGLTGKDVTIAVVDTGIYPHKDLEGRIVAFQDFVNKKKDPYDDNGHGTHCAGDAAGSGTASKGKYKGPAPEANLVGVKVLSKVGSGSLSTVIAGVNWCIENKEKHSIDIVSMSLGSQASQSAEEDPVVKIVEKAWDNGIVVCVAAGNSGPDPKTIGSPGTSPKVITVGAINDQDTTDRADDAIADFSSRGPTIDGIVKPDILTPGVNIISLRSPGSLLDKTNKSSRVGKDYFSLSGTSMATPICAGATALIIQNNPDLSPDQIKEQLLSGAEDLGLPPNTQGKGYLNIEKALKQ
ncbi:serine protease AprX [Scopulibacillus darangshiensis]|uniref:Serine protease AprX n=1 Tax=Scopulibacillus darangshiensis TaxID=442528 RepID=A0A4R2P2C7_9BACL|nr:S8 family peptidase [Scopulibacillus darangshiensis]TCP28879.1 serine protease AprX [Scopulibacillus darangshiensis]